MPIQFPDMMGVPSPEEHSPFLNQLTKAIQLGVGYPRQIQQADIANALKNIELQYAPEKQKLGLDLLRERIQAAQRESQITPEYKAALQSPEMKGILALEEAKKRWGENSFQYQTLKNSIESIIQGRTALASQRLNPMKSLSPTGKLLMERHMLEQGLSPTGTTWDAAMNNSLVTNYENNINKGLSQDDAARQSVQVTKAAFTPGQDSINQMKSAYDMAILQKNVPTFVKQKLMYATNIDKTLSRINPDDLVKYSGLIGAIEEKIQKGLSLTGDEDEAYDKYRIAMQNAEMLATQVRQFYGDSIQPSALARLEALTNPSTWQNNPKLAKKLFIEFKKLLESETETYRDAVKSTSVYTKKPEKSENIKIDYSTMSDSQLEQLAGIK